MTVRMFNPQFAPLVKSGVKCQTVRPVPKRMPKCGELISLREWTGKPYRSKQRVLGEAVITKVEPVKIWSWTLEIGFRNEYRIYSHPRDTDQLDAFARADGFSDFGELFEWFESEHGLPFAGIVIYWKRESLLGDDLTQAQARILEMLWQGCPQETREKMASEHSNSVALIEKVLGRPLEIA